MKKFWPQLLLISIFVISSILMITSARLDSATTDESVHLFAGFTYLTQHDYRLDPEHPPLIKEIAALPLLFMKPHYYLNSDWQKAADFYFDSWQQARALGVSFLYLWGNNASALLFWSRLMMIILTLCLGLAVYIYAKKLYGQTAGIFAAFLCLFNPIILAHGRLINTDIGVSLFIVLTIYFWSQYLKKISWQTFILTGIFLGLALASKYTAVILVPMMIVIAIIKFILDKKIVGKTILAFLGTCIIAFLVIWASYGFQVSAPPSPAGGLASQINSWSSVIITPRYDNFYDKIHSIFVPAGFFKGLVLISRHVVGGNGAFLLGHNSMSGWWYYFLVAIFFKTPIALFIFLGLAIYYYRKNHIKISFDEYVLVASALIFLIFAMTSRADLGVRHILPIYPFLIIFASKSINMVRLPRFARNDIVSIIFIIATVWYAAVGIGSFPNYIAYFNEFSGGSSNGYKVLTDSNLDWGQDVLRIKNYMDANNISNPYMVYPWGGDAALNYYGIKFIPLLPDMQNVHGDAIVSTTYYDTDVYSWLRKFPKTEITPGVFLIQIN